MGEALQAHARIMDAMTRPAAVAMKGQTMSKQQQQKLPADLVADAEQVLANLEARHEEVARERAADDAERSKVAYQAHALHELGAVNTLSEITGRAIARDQQLREIDCAIAEAAERLKTAQATEVAAVNRQKAAEAITLVKELGECFPYLDRKLAEAANALVAINDGVQKLHQAGFAFPNDSQLRLGVAAIIQSWTHRLPKHFHDQLRDGFEFLAPGRRQTAVEYWRAIEPSLNNQIAQHLGKPESEAA
jgi:hypothetical protein